MRLCSRILRELDQHREPIQDLVIKVKLLALLGLRDVYYLLPKGLSAAGFAVVGRAG